MRIEHVAIWTRDLEALRRFYEGCLGGRPGPKHVNPEHAFESYFLSFESGARLELMRMPSIPESADDPFRQAIGLAHVAFTVGSEAEVRALAGRLAAEGHRVVGAPRRTSDGYYEAVVLDPEGNRVEIAAEREPPADAEGGGARGEAGPPRRPG